MTVKEFKDRINEIANKYNLNLKVTEDTKNIYVKLNDVICAYVNRILPCFMSTDSGGLYCIAKKARFEILEALYELSKTPFKERQEEKRYIFPLPHLVTSDGQQQYLTNKDDTWFASRRYKVLRQTWKEEHLKYIPEEYRDFAVEFDEEKEY